jgi:hypothetical protein
MKPVVDYRPATQYWQLYQIAGAVLVVFVRGWATSPSRPMNYAGQSIVVRLQNQLFAISSAPTWPLRAPIPGLLTSRRTLD